MISDPEVRDHYGKIWAKTMESCDDTSNFPLALRQEKQMDTHQLYYNYPMIKVSPKTLSSQSVLETYNFRVNVTSRLYFEVGMHMLNSHVTLQMNSLNDHSYTVQGKQRGNLNVMDI